MMTPGSITFEWVRLILQLAGAIVVARLTVRWALSRYKSEKTWERRLSAYVDAVTALSEMRLVVGQWIDAIEQHREPWNSQSGEQERYRQAKRKLDEATATAQLLLPKSSSDLLKKVELDIEHARRLNDRYDDLNREYSVLDDGLTALVELGRDNLGPSVKAI